MTAMPVTVPPPREEPGQTVPARPPLREAGPDDLPDPAEQARRYAEAEEEGALNWQERALCAQADPEAFFPEKGGSSRMAKRVCIACEVRADCLEYALSNDERFGIWGGLTETERRRLSKRFR